MSNTNLVPRRRFKEFQNTGAWEQRKFSETFIYLQNNSLSRADLNYEQGLVKNVHYGDVLIKFGEILDVEKAEIPFISSNEFTVSSTSLLQNGDVIIADAAEDETVGKCSEIKGIDGTSVVSGLHTIPCRPNKTFASGYLGFYLNSSAYHDQLLPLMQGTKISSISKSALQNTDILYPDSEQEQLQIGQFFQSLDNLITVHQHKLEKIKSLKSAYLSEMFPAEGERDPKRRFAGFTSAWEQKKLKDISTYSNGGSFENDVKEKGRYELITLKSVDMSGNLVHSGRYVDIEVPTLIKGTLVMILSEQSPGLLGMTAQIPKDNAYVLNQRVAEIRPNQNVDGYFLSMAINRNQQYFSRCGAGTKVQNISKSNVENYEFLCPLLEEQQKIGTFFKCLDNLITLQERKLEKLQNIKKAYLNEMFI
ncbi:MAG: EcoKI restriction-modification system protein HsdS [Firmicutes bacterium ADurb.Bin419]|nr:MAG: EcoKI restriction-modification system protein HsdS [Firmicutes bacterium ADurb.Bin419]